MSQSPAVSPGADAALAAADPPRPRWRGMLQIMFFGLAIRPFMALLIGLRVRGRERLPNPRRAPFILIANHSSHLDTLSLLSLFSLTRLRFIRPAAAADYFASTPLRAWLSRTLINVLAIERSREKRLHDPIALMAQALDRGESVILFPEGTRGKGGAITPFRPGIARLALARPHIAIVPLWLGNMGRSLPKGEFIPVPMTCEIRVGEPRFCTGEPAAITAELEAAVRALGESGN